MADKRAYRPNVCDTTLEGRLVLSHVGISAEVAHKVHAAVRHVTAGHAVAKHVPVKHVTVEHAAVKHVPVKHVAGNPAGAGEGGDTSTVVTPPSSSPVFTSQSTPANVTAPSDPTPATAPASPSSGPIQSLPLGNMSAAQFSSLFQPTPTGPAMTAGFRFAGVPAAGTLGSQVFQGVGAAAGLYAYAYQVTAADVNDAGGQPVSIQSVSWHAFDTPVGTDLTGSGHTTYAYVISGGPVGDLATPQAAPSQGTVGPASITWQANSSSGTMAVSFANPAGGVSGLGAGGTSATFVLITRISQEQQQFVNVQAVNPNDEDMVTPVFYTPRPGTIVPIPLDGSNS